MLIDTSKEQNTRWAGRIAVSFKGEWPMLHCYRPDVGGPRLNGLEKLLEVDG